MGGGVSCEVVMLYCLLASSFWNPVLSIAKDYLLPSKASIKWQKSASPDTWKYNVEKSSCGWAEAWRFCIFSLFLLQIKSITHKQSPLKKEMWSSGSRVQTASWPDCLKVPDKQRRFGFPIHEKLCWRYFLYCLKTVTSSEHWWIILSPEI